MTRISDDELRQLDELVGRDPREALVILLAIEERYRDDPHFWLQSGGFYIDIGSALRVLEVVQHGIDVLEHILPDDPHPLMLYNLANGYSALEQLARAQEGYVFDPDSTPLHDITVRRLRAPTR